MNSLIRFEQLRREYSLLRPPIDHIEPLSENLSSHREAALLLRVVLEVAYEFVLQSSRPRMAMQQVGVALGLPSASRTTEAELALLNQVTRKDFSKGVTKFLRIAQLPAHLNLKPDAAKFAYRRYRT
jgi:hypothetical protein